MIAQWWTSREPRERLLIGMAGALGLLVFVWFVMVEPLQAAHAKAHSDYNRAVADRVLIEQGLVQLGTQGGLRSAGPARNGDSFRADIARTAQSRGLAISRLQSGRDGTLQLIFEDMSSAELFGWLTEIASQPGAETVRATVTRQGDRLQATIELRGTRP